MRNFQDTFETRKRSFISAFLICMTVPLRSKLRNKYLIQKSEESRLLYKKQRNVCVFLLKKAKKEYYVNFDLHNVTDTNRFGKQ